MVVLLWLLALAGWDMLVSWSHLQDLPLIPPYVIGFAVADGLQNWFCAFRFPIMMAVALGLIASFDAMLHKQAPGFVSFFALLTITRFRNRIFLWSR